jgi:hypothetical protein
MSTTATSTLQVVLSWSQTDTDTNATYTYIDAGSFLYNRTWGTGDISKVWHEQRTLTSGGQTIYNMTGLTGFVPGGFQSVCSDGSPTNVIKKFTNVRLIYVENLATGTGGPNGAKIAVWATGDRGFSGLFNGGSGNYEIGAKSPFLLANYLSGWNINETNCELTVSDVGGSGCQINVGVIGI